MCATACCSSDARLNSMGFVAVCLSALAVASSVLGSWQTRDVPGGILRQAATSANVALTSVTTKIFFVPPSIDSAGPSETYRKPEVEANNATFSFDETREHSALALSRAEGEHSQLPSRAFDITGRVVHIMDFNDTLRLELEQSQELVLNFTGGACYNHFYHLVVNAALPIFAKLIQPFITNGSQVPRRRVYISGIGGVTSMLADVFPELDFAFEPWVPQCCGGGPRLRCTGDGEEAARRMSQHAMPWFTLHSDGIRKDYAHHNAAGVAGFRRLATDFVRHTLDGAPHHSHSEGGLLMISRNGNTTAFHNKSSAPSIGRADTGKERRNIANEGELVLAIGAAFAAADAAAVSGEGHQAPTPRLLLVHLEEKSFGEQVALFRGVRGMIGQHGAGMVHCLWVPQEGLVMEIATNGNPLHFEWLCKKVRGHPYKRFQVPGGSERALVVPVRDFVQTLVPWYQKNTAGLH